MEAEKDKRRDRGVVAGSLQGSLAVLIRPRIGILHLCIDRRTRLIPRSVKASRPHKQNGHFLYFGAAFLFLVINFHMKLVLDIAF